MPRAALRQRPTTSCHTTAKSGGIIRLATGADAAPITLQCSVTVVAASTLPDTDRALRSPLRGRAFRIPR